MNFQYIPKKSSKTVSNLKYKYSFFFLFLAVLGWAQNFKVTYKTYSQDKETENQDPIVVFVNKNDNYVVTEKILAKTKDIPYEITQTQPEKLLLTSFGFLQDEKIASTKDNSVFQKYTYEEKPETKTILGHVCKKLVSIVNSNTIEIWYTNDFNVFGGPSILGQTYGLVLETIRNGNTRTTATKIEKIKQFPQLISNSIEIPETDVLSYKDLLWKSRFTTIPVFKDELVRFSDEAKSDEKILRFVKGTVILKKVKFPELKNKAIFAELSEQSNGDAYDRTGTVFVIPQNLEKSFFDALSKDLKEVPIYNNGNGKEYQGVVRTENYEPILELMRFFTPFGVGKYNNAVQLKDKNWHSVVSYRQDLSDLKPLLDNKEVWVGTWIGNYDKGGHKISLDFTFHDNEGVDLFKNNIAISLFDTTNIMEMGGQNYGTMFSSDKGLVVNFTLEKELKNAQLRYITTGHGGWENGDEFVPKENRIFLDEKLAYSFTPWRTDCGSYRLYNPASGNFGNGLSSSDYSRSNWCPGTTTNPEYISLGTLSAGKHSIQIQIPMGENDGSSFSSWNVSGVLIGKE